MGTGDLLSAASGTMINDKSIDGVISHGKLDGWGE